ncbi:RNA polymerase recycling motor ATPase HelR [Dietzia sp. SYD-A1]|uniref:RNA polymerase recycling motor ATPase HelR n=1 Tax=Dietzia sp. SYD-A1 TaxID=2780141 RepID=UPI0018911DA1|nr:RNA polymerase recycling motor ATPase HelR [Dietzia sp. SYD-A1]
MPPVTTSIFSLPDRLRAKADPALIAADEQRFSAIADCLAQRVTDQSARLAARRRDPAGTGAQTITRDADIRRLVAELATLRRFGLDLCIGHVALAGDVEPLYVGRIGLTDPTGTSLLVDWRSPAAEPFFAATLARPMGVRYRRRYRWSGGRIIDYWDEVLDDDEVGTHTALDDHSAFVASLGRARTGRMHDVLTTIQADQDAIIRADSSGALVVDGGPGTGKTVAALHRAAYLLHSESRLGLRRGHLLLVGPHRPYLDYVADVLPALGEHSVQTATLADLVPDIPAPGVGEEPDPEAARLKSGMPMVRAIEAAVRFYEQPPEQPIRVQTEWIDLELTPGDWAEAFASPEDGTPHNEARHEILQTLVEILLEKSDAGVPEAVLRAELLANADLRRELHRAWPMIDAAELVGDLWTVPAYLRLCAPWLSSEQARVLRRDEPAAWTRSDLPLLDAARHQLGDADRDTRRRRRHAERAAELQRRRSVIDEVIAADDDPEGVAPMLRHRDLQEALLDQAPDDDATTTDAARLAGTFAHIIVDEAQELSDAEWQMILRRCPSGHLTVVGDRAQARHDFAESWPERLERVGLSPGRVDTVHLTINYRTPSEVMEAAAPVIRAVRPDANVPVSVRSSGEPVAYGRVGDLRNVLEAWLESNPEGVACVITATGAHGDDFPASGVPASEVPASDRVRSLTAATAKGLEFDLVVLVDPGAAGTGEIGAGAIGVGTTGAGATDAGVIDAVDRYVAMTRATRSLTVLTR